MSEDGAFYCEAVYQGYQGSKASYRRSDGLRPESGSIVLMVEDVKKLQLNVPGIEWRPVNGMEFDGGLDIRSWARFKSSQTTTADRPPAPEPKGQGLNLFGDLVLRQRQYPTGKLIEEMKYSNVYVDSTFIESTEDLANILEHQEGEITVALTDIRRYYADYGPFFGRINCRRKTGAWDRETIRENGKPWDFSDVVQFLFTQLVGSPAVDKESDLFVEIVDPPMGVEGQGEPAFEHLERLLERFGFKAQMQPDGNYAVNKVFSRRLGKLSIPTGVRKPARDAEEILAESSERLTANSTHRPPAMVGLGPRRVQRMTAPCVAVLQNPEDGLYYEIEVAAKKMGYSMEELNRQVFSTPELQFDDVPPRRGESLISDELHERRRAALRMAYRLYLPAFLFLDGGRGVDLDDPAIDEIPFLPMVACPWYKSQLKAIEKQHPAPKGGAKGDLEDFVLLPPVVRGHTTGDTLFPGFKECQEAFQAQLLELGESLRREQFLHAIYTRKAKGAAEDLLRSERVAFDTKSDAKLKEFGVQAGGPLDIGGDIRQAAAELGVVFPEAERIKATTESQTSLHLLKHFTELAKRQTKRILEHEKPLVDLERNFENFKKAYEDRRMIPARMTIGQQVLVDPVSVDTATGLIQSSAPLCRTTRPIFFDGDDQEVAADGAVTITFAHELKGSGPSSFTNYLFFADDGGDPDKVAEVKFGGCHRSSPIKAKVFPIESREYLEDNGNPMNWNACYSEAKAKATAQMALPRRAPGWTLELHGMRKAILDAGAIAIHHEWDGDVGRTYVVVNAPGAPLPWLPAGAAQKRPTNAADWRERWQRESGAGGGL